MTKNLYVYSHSQDRAKLTEGQNLHDVLPSLLFIPLPYALMTGSHEKRIVRAKHAEGEQLKEKGDWC